MPKTSALDMSYLDFMAVAAEPGTGVTAICLPDDPALKLLIMAGICREACAASHRLGIKMPMVEQVVTVLSGNERSLEVADRLDRTFAKSKRPTAHHRYHHIQTGQRLNWLSEAGLAHLTPLLLPSASGWLVVEQAFAKPLSEEDIQTLVKLDAQARAASTRVMLFVSGLKDAKAVSGLCRDLWTVELCEPEEGTQCAFTIVCDGLSELGVLHTSQRMAYFSRGIHGLKMRTEPFVAAKNSVRLMARLRAAGATMAEIAEAYGCDKSTVSRSLKAVPEWPLETEKMSKVELLLQLHALRPKAPSQTKASNGSSKQDSLD